MDWLKLPEQQVDIAAAPVSRADYARFAQETRSPIPPRSGAPTSPVTRVSAEEAGAFAAWLSQHDGYRYRLPTLNDILTLAERADKGESPENMPLDLQQTVVAGDPRPLSEWLQCVPDHGDGRNSLRCVANPSWLRRNGGASVRGALSEGRYSFVTFRVVRAKG